MSEPFQSTSCPKCNSAIFKTYTMLSGLYHEYTCGYTDAFKGLNTVECFRIQNVNLQANIKALEGERDQLRAEVKRVKAALKAPYVGEEYSKTIDSL